MSQMVVLLRLSFLALAMLALAVAVTAQGTEEQESAPPPCTEGCEPQAPPANETGPGNETSRPAPPEDGDSSPPPEDSAAPPPPSEESDDADPLLPPAPAVVPPPVDTTCDLVRPTGGKPKVSVNPVLGVVKVDPGCVTRWIDGGIVQVRTLGS